MKPMKKQCLKKSVMVLVYLICCSFVLEGCCTGGRLAYVNAKVWKYEANSTTFPELNGSLQVPWLKERPSFGIAFSGGGTRSATATLGQLRALHQLGWLEKVQYITAVSGGSWSAVPYTYLPKSISDEVFLGEYQHPSTLTKDDLYKTKKNSMADVIQDVGYVFFRYIRNAIILRGDETYVEIIGQEFLKPLQIYNRNKLFTFHQNALDEILNDNKKSQNADYYMEPDDFFIVKEKRPYLIVGGTILYPKTGTPQDLYPLEITPLYTGVRVGNSTKGIGGGYVESFAYDSTSSTSVLRNDGKRLQFKIGNKKHRFTLSDVIGISGAAPEQILTRYVDVGMLGFPELMHWPIKLEERAVGKEMNHGDGGHTDNLGLMPLLVRKVKNIIVFINTKTPFNSSNYDGRVNKNVIVDDLIGYFKNLGNLQYNIVFADPEKKLEELYNNLKDRKSKGAPLVFCDSYDVVENERYGISPYKTKICWVYLDRTKQWMDEMEKNNDPAVKEIVKQIKTGEKPFDRFPHFETFFQDGQSFQVIDLDRKEVNALSNLTAWTIVESKDYITKELDIGLPAKNK